MRISVQCTSLIIIQMTSGQRRSKLGHLVVALLDASPTFRIPSLKSFRDPLLSFAIAHRGGHSRAPYPLRLFARLSALLFSGQRISRPSFVDNRFHSDPSFRGFRSSSFDICAVSSLRRRYRDSSETIDVVALGHIAAGHLAAEIMSSVRSGDIPR